MINANMRIQLLKVNVRQNRKSSIHSVCKACYIMFCGVFKECYLTKKEAAAEVVVGAVVVTAGVLQGGFVCEGEFACAGECVL